MILRREYVVFEPHVDDAFLSLGGHMERWVKEGAGVTVVSICSATRHRARDATAYAAAIRARSVLLAAHDHHTAEIKRVVRERVPGILEGFVSGEVATEVIALIPLAIKHPDHVVAREALEALEWLSSVTVLHYVDQPYAITQASTQRVNELLRGSIIHSHLYPHRRKYRHVPLFKDQSKFFYFNPVDKLVRTTELIVKVSLE